MNVAFHFMSSFLLKYGAVSIHHTCNWNIQSEKVLPPEITSDIFTQIIWSKKIITIYNLRHINHFEKPFIRTVYNGTESVSYLGPNPLDTGRKLNVHKTFSLRPVSRGKFEVLLLKNTRNWIIYIVLQNQSKYGVTLNWLSLQTLWNLCRWCWFPRRVTVWAVIKVTFLLHSHG